MSWPTELVLGSPRGFCAGVDRAILIVEEALRRFGAPVYVRHEIVHNTHVVADLAARGAVFVEDETEIPEGAHAVFSAHGSPPEAFDNAGQQDLQLIDATCPLVLKVHQQALRASRDGLDIVLIGHEGHQEVLGTMGQAPRSITLVETVADVDALEGLDPDKVTYLTQTTLSMDETAGIVDALRAKFPALIEPPSQAICYATQNRQDAVKALVSASEDRPAADLVIVVGSQTSSNSKRLVDVAHEAGVDSFLVDDVTEIDEARVCDHHVVGLVSGASAPERLVQDIVAWLQERGTTKIRTLEVTVEDVDFQLPSALAGRRSS